MTAAVHELDRALFDRLAAGGGGAPAIEALRAAQVSKHLQLIGHLLEHWPGAAGERDNVVSALDRARLRSPERFREIVGAPLVGAWTAIAARALHQGMATPAEFRQLAALAMVACAATGVDGEAEVPVRDGLVALPGLGALAVGAVESARLAATDGHLTVYAAGATVLVPGDGHARAERAPASRAPGWLPVRRLTGAASGRRLSLGLDDVDPYRHGHHAPPALRLPEAEVDDWRRLFSDAWELLAGLMPDRAAELTAGLRTLVPLTQADDRSARSATIRHAFGVFGLTRPPSAADFAVTIVHEFQHSKLSALLDLVPMSDPEDKGRYFAPWRTDPRPLAGLLQGIYAFVGVADTWRALRHAEGIGPVAEQQFANARLQVHTGLSSVERAPGLTDAGRAFTAHLRRTTDALLAEAVPPAMAQAAEADIERTRERWLRHNISLN